MKRLVIGILAHVDAGKTTLSESLLYLSGKIGKLGRVDNKDAYFDNFELERARGITIFSKQAVFSMGETQVTLLDTPGHVDFSAEMERTLQVLDYAVLVISGADGIQGHTRTLWRLLALYQIPVFLFVNKMDQNGTEHDALLRSLKNQLSEGCIDFGQCEEEGFFDQLAMCSESMMETYLETGTIETAQIRTAVWERSVFPCYFGSALKLQGIEALMDGIAAYTEALQYREEFGAKVYKISRDEQGNRLTHLKVTGGLLKVRDLIAGRGWEEKVNQIRIYSGSKYEATGEAHAGSVCAVTGLSLTKPGEGLGMEHASDAPILEPVLLYRVNLPEGVDPRTMLPKLRQIEEEEPELHLVWEEQLQEIQAQLMGEVQIEILQNLIMNRFGVPVTFGEGRIVYKETIADVVEGVGHFEPLRHYAEVHLIMEPGEPGSGLQFDTNCSEDVLGRNWQRLILSHLEEKEHKGVLTGSPVTDLKITLAAGKAHSKHTEGGDFREATYRAVRQGLMEAESVLLEPYYAFQLELPQKMVGRAMNDIEKMCGSCKISQTNGESILLAGAAPVATMRNYQQEVVSYTKGQGRLFCSLSGYAPCHNSQEVLQQIGYVAEHDLGNTADSVFCTHGSGYLVPWNEVKSKMHLESCLHKDKSTSGTDQNSIPIYGGERQISQEEIERILNKTFFANQGKKSVWKRRIAPSERQYEPIYHSRPQTMPREQYLLIDGYNIIHAWPELKEHADQNMDGARMKLIDILSNYQAIRNCRIIAVFDAYRVQGHREEIMDYHNIHLVFTREAQTADQYIEKFAHDNQQKYDISVATSDGLQQIIVRGAGCALLSARELKEEIEGASQKLMREYHQMQEKERNTLLDALTPEIRAKLESM